MALFYDLRRRAQFDHYKSVTSVFKKKSSCGSRILLRMSSVNFQSYRNLKIVKFPLIEYCQRLKSLQIDFSGRFKDVLSLKASQWVMNPFMNIGTAEVQIQEELVEFSTNETFKASFQNVIVFKKNFEELKNFAFKET